MHAKNGSCQPEWSEGMLINTSILYKDLKFKLNALNVDEIHDTLNRYFTYITPINNQR